MYNACADLENIPGFRRGGDGFEEYRIAFVSGFETYYYRLIYHVNLISLYFPWGGGGGHPLYLPDTAF